MMNSVGFKHWEPSRGGRENKSWGFFSPMVGNGCRWIKKKSFIKKSPPPPSPAPRAGFDIIHLAIWTSSFSVSLSYERGEREREKGRGKREKERGERMAGESGGGKREGGEEDKLKRSGRIRDYK